MSLKSLIKGWVEEVQGTLAKKMFLDSNVDARSTPMHGRMLGPTLARL